MSRSILLVVPRWTRTNVLCSHASRRNLLDVVAASKRSFSIDVKARLGHHDSLAWKQQTSRASCRGSFSTSYATRGFSTSASRRLPEILPKDEQKATALSRPISQQTAEPKDQPQISVSQSVTHENIYNLPNFLTLTRLVAAPVVGYLVLHDQHVLAASLFIYAGVTDLVDGWIARKWKLQTVVGSVVDPMADKLLMTILTVCLAVKGALPIWIAGLILGRDVSLATAAIYYRYASLPSPKSLARYWNFSLPSAEVHPTNVSKYNTFLQLVLIGAITLVPVAGPAVDAFLGNVSSGGLSLNGTMTAFQYLVAATTVWSGASYLWTKDAVKILGTRSHAEKMQILTRGRMIIGISFLACGGIALALERSQ